MASHGFLVFDTIVGPVGLVWSTRGLAGVQLPEASRAATVARIRRRFPGAAEREPPPSVHQAAARITALLEGEPADLSEIELDLEGLPPFEHELYQLVRTIPPGSTMSYGQLAARMGQPGASRAVGQALGRNPWAIVVPCHRVLAASGRLGGFSAHGGRDTKRRLLALESRHADDPLGLFRTPPEESI